MRHHLVRACALSLVATLYATCCGAQAVMIPEGTRIRVRLNDTITSATAEQGQTVELSVTEPVKIGDTTVFTEGARATGTIVEAHEKRRMGRAGKLDFSIDRVKGADDMWVPVRYTVNKKSGESHALRTGIITAGVAVVFWPAAPVMLLLKGKDIVINKGIAFDVYTDGTHSLLAAEAGTPAAKATATSSALLPTKSVELATVIVKSDPEGADVSVDGKFVGNTPSTLQLSPGDHMFIIERPGYNIWQRSVSMTPGGIVTLNGTLGQK